MYHLDNILYIDIHYSMFFALIHLKEVINQMGDRLLKFSAFYSLHEA